MYVLNTHKEIVHVDVNIFASSSDLYRFLWKQKYNVSFTSNSLECLQTIQIDSNIETNDSSFIQEKPME